MVAGANMQVAVVGTVQTSPAVGGANQTVNQGNQGTIAQRWYVQLTDGTNTVPVIVSPRGNFLSVGEGSVNSGTSLNAVSANTTGTVIDFGSASLAATFQIIGSAALTGGAVTLLGSADGTNFFSLGTPTLASTASPANPYALSGITNAHVSFNGIAVRYFRADVTTPVTGGTVTVKVAAF